MKFRSPRLSRHAPSATMKEANSRRLARRFFDLSHVFDGPMRWGASVRFDTKPSRPMRQTCSNTVGPSPARCSLNRIERRLALPISLASRRLRSISGRSVVSQFEVFFGGLLCRKCSTAPSI
jgi:hypothetical protein